MKPRHYVGGGARHVACVRGGVVEEEGGVLVGHACLDPMCDGLLQLQVRTCQEGLRRAVVQSGVVGEDLPEQGDGLGDFGCSVLDGDARADLQLLV